MMEISKLRLLTVQATPIMAESEDQELERRLSLYQVFLKLYEHHRGLLDEILQLESLGQPSLTGVKPRYLQGVVDGSLGYIITNLRDGETQTLQQPQQMWTMGRDRNCAIYLGDRRLSRRHAAIRYFEGQGFYLIDFKSTNGSYVNGERIHEPIKLKDGDQILLGSMTFSFFVANLSRSLPPVPVELLRQVENYKLETEVEKSTSPFNREKPLAGLPEESANYFRPQGLSHSGTDSAWQQLSSDKQSEILDRFLDRQSTNDIT